MLNFIRRHFIMGHFNQQPKDLEIIADASYVGKQFYCTGKYGNSQVFGTWEILSGQNYAEINSNGKVTIYAGVQNQNIIIRLTYNNISVNKTINITYDNQLNIEGPDTMSGTSGNVITRYNGEIITPVYNITSGSTYSTIDSTGTITILDSGIITLIATYSGYTTAKNITLVYDNNTSSSTEIHEDGSITTTETTIIENQDGSTTEITTTSTTNEDGSLITTETEITTNQDGSSTTTTTTTNSDGSSSETTSSTSAPDEHGTVTTEESTTTIYSDGTSSETTSTTTENQDGSSTSSSTTTNYDENGDTLGSSETETTTNQDGSSSSTTTNYNENGDPTSAQNNTTDTDGNQNTQEITYDENGDPVVTGYTIDTSGSEDGEKNYNGDGVNTEYYAFDVTHGFVLDINFTFDFVNQPAGQNENHHNILTMKRSTPEPWYGFQLRQTSTNKFIILGTQFSTGSNTNTTLNPHSLVNNVGEYNLKIIYNPNASERKFVCHDMISDTDVFISNNTFPDIEDLRYLKVMIGCAMDENGDPYRYSNVNILNFSINRLSIVSTPVISCSNNTISITSATQGASIYYRLNNTGNYVPYTSSISINADTTVEAYAELNNERSEIASQLCLYDNGIEDPVIYCNGELVTITCNTPSVDIYYRLNQTGVFTLYESAIQLNADTIVEAYARLNNATSHTVSETCIYDPIILVSPTIICNGEEITLSCSTYGATIYYRLNNDGNYIQYSTPISILEDTYIEAYASINGQVSSVVSETCLYNPVHHYERDYLTFKILTAGTVLWKSIGSGQEKTIEYSLNNNAWTSITATSAGVSISVVDNDIIRFRGTNTAYAKDKSNYSGFDGGTATYNIEGNIMSLVYGDNFIDNNTLTGTYNFCSLFKQSNVISAENLILSPTTLTGHCYRALFSKALLLTTPPALPATTLATYCYYYMFENCPFTTAPELLVATLPTYAYGYMFTGCSNLNFIRCLATNISASGCTTGWVSKVASSGTFIKDVNMSSWTRGNNGIPTSWTIVDDSDVADPEISYNGFDTVTITCATQGAAIYYKLNQSGTFSIYSTPITINADTTVYAYASLNNETSNVATLYCTYVSDVPFEESNRELNNWTYNNQRIVVPYSINDIDGQTSNYAKGTFNFETTFALRQAQPAYLWFQHADQSAAIYVDDILVEKHWGGYTAFFTDISNYVHAGTNNIKVAIKNNEGNNLAPAAGDFNFNATLGYVKLFTSPVLPAVNYGYDGFHITSTVSSSSATIYVKTNIPIGASVECIIDDGTYHYTDTKPSTGEEMTFTTTISNPHLWSGISDPHLYNVTMNIYYNNELYHTFSRGYGLRYYDYVINDTTILQSGDPYTGFLLNGQPYYLRGVCMHNDKAGKANALTRADIISDFNIIQELGCNFIRLAHYPHPKEVYDMCDQLGIIVQTEAPCVNKLQSTMPTEYYTHLTGQYEDMVNQHYNHPCIIFWGLSNETTTDDTTFANTKINEYISLIKNLDSERWVGYVMSHSYSNPLGYYNYPNVDWVGGNIYVGWYIDKASNNPTSQLNTRIANTITSRSIPFAFSEYGAGGTQHCHSEDPQTTTTKGNYERHDIEYQMWLHEGHISALRNFPQLLFTSEWQLFDIAVANRNEGYTVCYDCENSSIDDNLRRLNNKGLVERDHITKKDTFYIYKAEWSSEKFVHICGKDYTKMTSRIIKCYTNSGNSLKLYVNNTLIETISATNNIGLFTARTYSSGDIIRVDGDNNTSDTFTFT